MFSDEITAPEKAGMLNEIVKLLKESTSDGKSVFEQRARVLDREGFRGGHISRDERWHPAICRQAVALAEVERSNDYPRRVSVFLLDPKYDTGLVEEVLDQRGEREWVAINSNRIDPLFCEAWKADAIIKGIHDMVQVVLKRKRAEIRKLEDIDDLIHG